MKKYISKLKKKVMEQQDATAQMQNEKMITTIIKKLKFN